MLNQRFWLSESSMTKLKWFSLDYLWIQHFPLIFRYQRLVPGRENIAAEHLVPQLGYVATSKTIILLQLVHYLNGRLYTFKCHRPIFTVLLSRFKTIWTVFTAKHIKLDGIWHVSHFQVMVRWWSRSSASRLQNPRRLRSDAAAFWTRPSDSFKSNKTGRTSLRQEQYPKAQPRPKARCWLQHQAHREEVSVHHHCCTGLVLVDLRISQNIQKRLKGFTDSEYFSLQCPWTTEQMCSHPLMWVFAAVDKWRAYDRCTRTLLAARWPLRETCRPGDAGWWYPNFHTAATGTICAKMCHCLWERFFYSL